MFRKAREMSPSTNKKDTKDAQNLTDGPEPNADELHGDFWIFTIKPV